MSDWGLNIILEYVDCGLTIIGKMELELKDNNRITATIHWKDASVNQYLQFKYF